MGRIWYPEDGDPDDPETSTLYAWQSIPVVGRNPLVFGHESVPRAISKHAHELAIVPAQSLRRLADENGMIHVDQLPVPSKKLFRPYRGDQSAYNPMLQWIPADADVPEPVRIQDPAQMTVQERSAQIERLRYLGYKIDEPDPKTPTAQETVLMPAPRWDPNTHTAAEVIAYVLECDDLIERERVLAAERTGRARKRVLKRLGGEIDG